MCDDAVTLMRNQKIILFDAQCKLCSAWCNFIISNDANVIFKLCSVQSPKGALLLTCFAFFNHTRLNGLPTNGKAYTQSHAF
ncbi:DCC1-like thiol-disulfide oxidoreductase family protein (plasmid) [Pseudoalteromonas espejiana]